MRRLFAVLAILAPTLGCKPGVGVYISPSEPRELRAATEHAIEAFNDEIGVPLLDLREDEVTALGYLEPGSIIVVSRETVIGDPARNAYTFVAGVVNHVAVETAFLEDPELSATDRDWLVMHEIGHALGLKHESDETNLMYDDPWFGDVHFDLTRKQIRRIRAFTGLKSAF